MNRAYFPAAGLLTGGLISVLVGLWAMVGLLGLALATLVLMGAPVLGTYVLVALAQLDGIALIVDQRIPVSTFKIVTVLLLCALLLTLRRNQSLQRRMNPSPVMAFAILFAIWIVVAQLFSTDPQAGRDSAVDFLQTMMLVPIIALTVTTVGQLRWLVWVIAASGAISALFVVSEVALGVRWLPYAQADDIGNWRGVVRSAGASAYNPTTSAQLMSVSLLISATMALYSSRRRALWAAIAVACMIALPLMGARSAILAALFGFGMLALSLRKHRLFPHFILGCVAVCIALMPVVPANVWDRFADLPALFQGGGSADFTLQRRLSYHEIGFDVWAANPITGSGPGTFPALYADDAHRWVPGRTQQMRQLHNSYLSVAAQMGLVGIVLFLASVGGACIAALRAGRAPRTEAQILAKSLGIGTVVFLLGSLFMPHESNKYMWILMALCARASLLSRSNVFPLRSA